MDSMNREAHSGNAGLPSDTLVLSSVRQRRHTPAEFNDTAYSKVERFKASSGHCN